MEGSVDLGYPAMYRPGVELAISRSHSDDLTTTTTNTMCVFVARRDCKPVFTETSFSKPKEQFTADYKHSFSIKNLAKNTLDRMGKQFT